MAYKTVPSTFGASVFHGRVGEIDLPAAILPDGADTYTPSGGPRRMLTGVFGMDAPPARPSEPLPFDIPDWTTLRIGMGDFQADADRYYRGELSSPFDQASSLYLSLQPGYEIDPIRAAVYNTWMRELERLEREAITNAGWWIEQTQATHASNRRRELMRNNPTLTPIGASAGAGLSGVVVKGLAGVFDWIVGSSSSSGGSEGEPSDIAEFRENLRQARAYSNVNLKVAQDYFAQAMSVYASNPGRFAPYSDEVETARQAIETVEGQQREADQERRRRQAEFNARSESPVLDATSEAFGYSGIGLAARGAQAALNFGKDVTITADHVAEDVERQAVSMGQKTKETFESAWSTTKTVAAVAGAAALAYGAYKALGAGR